MTLSIKVLLGALFLLQAGGGQETPAERLWAAARRGDAAQVRELLAQGAPVNAATRYGVTALMFAADRGSLDVVQILLDHGAEVNVTDNFYNSTPVGAALSNGHEEVARLLLEHGADGAADVLDFAIERDKKRLASSALATGRVTSDRLASALEAAAKKDWDDIVELIRKRQEDAPPPPQVRIDRSLFPKYVGEYRNEEEKASMRVTLSEEGLQIEGPDLAKTLLEGTGEGSFKAKDGSDLEVSFFGRGGTVETLAVARGDKRLFLSPFDPKEVVATPAAATDVPAPPVSYPRKAAINWPAFRGSNAAGNGDGQGIPVRWNVADGTHVKWRTSIPGIANSSPIIWGDRIFLTTSVSKTDASFRPGLYGDVAPVDDLSEHSFRVYCLDRLTGKIVWEREAHAGIPGAKRHTKASQANETPVTDGKRVVALFGSIGLLIAYDLDGKELWRKDIGVLNSGWFYNADYEWGHGSSPILYDDLVIVQADIAKGSFIAAWRIDTGEEAWRTARDEISTWSTPALFRGGNRDELVTNGPRIRAYDPSNGKPLWTLGPNSEVVVGTPVVGHGLIFLTGGYPPVRPVYAVRPGGSGDLSLNKPEKSSQWVAWSHDRGGTYIPSPILYGDYLYLTANNGRLTCYEAKTGRVVYQERIGGGGGSFVASPVASDGRLYFTSETGEVHVVRAGPRYELLAKNEMNEVCVSTPAISDGVLVVRTLHDVYGIAEDQ